MDFTIRQVASDAVYDHAHTTGVISLVVAAFLSGFAVLSIFITVIIRPSALSGTHVGSYLVSLLVANALQSIGTGINLKWVLDQAVEEGAACTLQAGLKQAGNVGTAVWSFFLASYVFTLIFLRSKPSASIRYLILVWGWCAIIFVVLIGPLGIQSNTKGPYFGPSGYWCWITDAYPSEQTFLEYFFEFLSAGISFFLYVGILLRVRGNLVHTSDGWHLRFVPRSERWQLAINRDWIDSTMMRVAALLVWYPISYSLLLVPVSIARLIEFGGATIPFGATIFTDTLFNLQGLVNVILFIITKRLFPEDRLLPKHITPRKEINMSSPEALGITPFVLPAPGSQQEESEVVRHTSGVSEFHSTMSPPTSARRVSIAGSVSTVNSSTPLNGN